MTDSDLSLNEDEVSLLVDYRRMDGDAVLVADDVAEQIREVLSGPLREAGVNAPAALPLEALVEQYDAEGPAETAALGSQMPSTGGASAGGDADTDLRDALSARDAADLRRVLKRMDLFAARDMSDRAEELAAEACEIAGVEDVAEIDRDALAPDA